MEQLSNPPGYNLLKIKRHQKGMFLAAMKYYISK